MALFNSKQKKDERSSVVNSAKTLLANIRFMDVDNPVHTMAITSSVPNEGKTFVAANLASAIATSGKSCLLVECDMRRRSMSRALGVHAQHGIYAVMAGECTVHEAAVPTQTPNLFFLDAEPRIPNPSDLLNSNRFTKLVELARNNYDYVIFDTPPVGTFVDAAVLGTKVDAVFMVVREGFTRKQEVAQAADQLKKAGCNLAGMVMNYCARSHKDEYYFEYYYREERGASSSAPQIPASMSQGGRRSTHLMDDDNTSEAVPTAPPSRRSRKKGDAAVPAVAPTAAPDDTGTYERLAEQVAAAQRAGAEASNAAAAAPAPTAAPNPYIPNPKNYDEF